MEDYEDIRCLGRGAYAVVRLVRRKKDSQYLVAKKFLQPMNTLTIKERIEVAQEIKLLSHLHHKNIIQFIDSFIDKDGYQILLMEYAPYGTLHSYLVNQNGEYLSESRIWEIFIQIVLAIHYIHGCNILHRDIKSQNILLAEPEGRMIKLGDFGIAQILQHGNTKSLLSTSNRNTTSSSVSINDAETTSIIVGTPHYLSPEICQGQTYDHKSDIWSLGCVLYELCCLHRPFDASNVPAIIFQVTRNKPKPLPSGLYSTELNNLVFSLLRSSPIDRPNIHEILALPIVQQHIQIWKQTLKNYSHNNKLPNILPVPNKETSKSKKQAVSSINHTVPYNERNTMVSKGKQNVPFVKSNQSFGGVSQPLLSARSMVSQWTVPTSIVSSISSTSSSPSDISRDDMFMDKETLSSRRSITTDMKNPEKYYLQLIEQAFLDPINIPPTTVTTTLSYCSTPPLSPEKDASHSTKHRLASSVVSNTSTNSTRNILRDRLFGIETKFLSISPSPSGRVWETLGASWAELGNFGNAVRCYRFALRAKSIIAPLDALEQLGNLLVRYSHQLYRKYVYQILHNHHTVSPHTLSSSNKIMEQIIIYAKEALMGISMYTLPKDAKAMIIPPSPVIEDNTLVMVPPVWKILIQALLEEGISSLERACSLGNTAERRALLGSALRQRAWMGLTPKTAALLPITTITIPEYPLPTIERKIILENGKTIISKLSSIPSITGDLKRAAEAYAVAHELEVEERITKLSGNQVGSTNLPLNQNKHHPHVIPIEEPRNYGMNSSVSDTFNDEDVENKTVPYRNRNSMQSEYLGSSSKIHNHHSHNNNNHHHPNFHNNQIQEGKGWKSIFHQPPYARLNQLSLEILASGTDNDTRPLSMYIDACREAETWGLESTEADPTDIWRWLLVVEARRLRYVLGDSAITINAIVHDYQEQFAFGVSTRMKSNVLSELQFELDILAIRKQEAYEIQEHMYQLQQFSKQYNNPEELHTVLTNNTSYIMNHIHTLIDWLTKLEQRIIAIYTPLQQLSQDIVIAPEQEMDHIYKEEKISNTEPVLSNEAMVSSGISTASNVSLPLRPSPHGGSPLRPPLISHTTPVGSPSLFPALEPILEEEKKTIRNNHHNKSISSSSTYTPSLESVVEDKATTVGETEKIMAESQREIPISGPEIIPKPSVVINTTDIPAQLSLLPSSVTNETNNLSSSTSITPKLSIISRTDSHRTTPSQNPFARSTPKEAKFIPCKNRKIDNNNVHSSRYWKDRSMNSSKSEGMIDNKENQSPTVIPTEAADEGVIADGNTELLPSNVPPVAIIPSQPQPVSPCREEDNLRLPLEYTTHDAGKEVILTSPPSIPLSFPVSVPQNVPPIDVPMNNDYEINPKQNNNNCHCCVIM